MTSRAVFSDRRGRPAVDLVPFRLSVNMRNARPIVDTFRPLVTSPPQSRGGDGYGVEFIECEPGSEVTCGDDQVERLLEAGWLPEHVVLLTTQHRHPVQKENEKDRDAYWRIVSDQDDVFYSTVAGFKGLERPVVVLVADGFHDGVSPASVMYTGMSRASDLLVVVGARDVVADPLGEASMRRLEGKS
jgi:Superfamily I DNA and RNA helicases